MFMPDHSTARALLAFRAAHGRRWKAKLLFLWSTGRDVEEANGACLRQLREEASPAIQDLASRAQDLAARSIDYCAHTSDQARRQLRHASEATSRYVSQQPGKSVAIAVASGAALGALALWLSRRSSAH